MMLIIIENSGRRSTQDWRSGRVYRLVFRIVAEFLKDLSIEVKGLSVLQRNPTAQNRLRGGHTSLVYDQWTIPNWFSMVNQP